MRRNVGPMAWLGLQMLAWARFMLFVAGGGMWQVMREGRFGWAAWGQGTLCLLLGLIMSLSWALAARPAAGIADTPLGLGTLLSFALMGLCIGRRAAKVPYHEVVAASLVATVAWFGALGQLSPPRRPGDLGAALLSVLGSWRHGGAGGRLGYTLGEYLAGNLWPQQVALLLAAGFLLAQVVASLAAIGRRGPWAMEWAVARRHLAGRGRALSVTAQVAVLGIALGVAALVAVTAVMSGYQRDVEAKILSINAHLVVQKYGLDFVAWPQVVDEAKAMPQVAAAGPFVFNEVLIAAGNADAGILLKGVPLHGRPEEDVTDLRHHLPKGPGDGAPPTLSALLRADPAGPPKILLGQTLLARLDLRAGDRIWVTMPAGLSTLRGQAPARRPFEVAGGFASGMHEFDAGLAFAELGAAQDLLGMHGRVNGVEVRLHQPQAAHLASRQLLGRLGGHPYHTLDWRQLNGKIFTALSLQKVVMVLVLTFIVVVAAFNIASTLFIAVVERACDISVLKSMGAHDLSILRIFVMQGWVVGGLGTLGGLAIGLGVAQGLGHLNLGIAADVYMVEHLRVACAPIELLMTAAAALGISHLATLYPSLKAAAAAPAAALKVH